MVTNGRSSGHRGLRNALLLWWITSALGATAAASPLMPWLEVLRHVPFQSVSSDVGLLFDRLSTGPDAAHALPIGPVIEATLWQLLLWRLLLLVPTALTMAAVVHSARANALEPTGMSRSLTRALVQLPNLAAITLALQTLTLVGVGVGLGYAAARLTAPAAGLLDVVVGSAVGALTVLFFAICLTTMEAARLSLFRRGTSFARAPATSCIVDGIAIVRRYGWRLMGKVMALWALGLFSGLVFSGVGSYLTATWPSALGNVASWAISQLGLGVTLVCRVACWREVWRRIVA